MLDELHKALTPDQEIQVTVWAPDNDNVEYSFSSVIISKVGALFMIMPPDTQPQRIIPLLQKDVVVGVVLEKYPSSFIFYPVVHALPAKDDPKGGYWLKIQSSTQVEVLKMDAIQRRRHVRIPMVVPFEVEYHGGLKTPAHTVNVSGGGLRFTSSVSFEVDQELLLHIQLNPTLPMLHLKAKVVMSAHNRLSKRGDDMYAAACQFLEMDDAREMIIVRECFRRELRQAGN
jgi:c-di-GMP-binding flagellar brake protein YcgR